MLILVILVVASVQSDDEKLQHPENLDRPKQNAHKPHDQVRIKTASRFHRWYEISRHAHADGESVAEYRASRFQSVPESPGVFARHASGNDVVWLHRKAHFCHPT